MKNKCEQKKKMPLTLFVGMIIFICASLGTIGNLYNNHVNPTTTEHFNTSLTLE